MEEEKFPFRVETDAALQKKFLDSTDSKLHVKLDFEKKISILVGFQSSKTPVIISIIF